MSKLTTRTVFSSILFSVITLNGAIYAQETTLVLGKSNLLSDARLSGTGIFNANVDGTNMVIVGDAITALDGDTVTILNRTFDVTSDTVICKMEEAISASKLNIGDKVVLTSASNSTDAISIKVGPLLLGGIMTGLKPVDFDCGSLKPIAWWEFWK